MKRLKKYLVALFSILSVMLLCSCAVSEDMVSELENIIFSEIETQIESTVNDQDIDAYEKPGSLSEVLDDSVKNVEDASDGQTVDASLNGDNGSASVDDQKGDATSSVEPGAESIDDQKIDTDDQILDADIEKQKNQDDGTIPTEENGDKSGTTGDSAADTTPSKPSGGVSKDKTVMDEHGSFNSKDEVALYIYVFGHLPSNYITKKAAEELGWSGGSLEPYAPGKSIGGSRFGNYEGLLPSKEGRVYMECDIDTAGKKSRGAKRIVYSNDGLIYYTEDHYESFELLYGEE